MSGIRNSTIRERKSPSGKGELMPVLKNPRHEKFSQLLASGRSAKDAYSGAGYRPSDSNGAWLAKKDEISSRVAEINAQALERERATAAAAERAVVTRQSLVEKLEATRKAAHDTGQFSAAVAATKEIAILCGLRIERSERGQPGEFEWIEKLTVDELQLLAEGKLDIDAYRGSSTGRLN
jgi:hypothetical protein